MSILLLYLLTLFFLLCYFFILILNNKLFIENTLFKYNYNIEEALERSEDCKISDKIDKRVKR